MQKKIKSSLGTTDDLSSLKLLLKETSYSKWENSLNNYVNNSLNFTIILKNEKQVIGFILFNQILDEAEIHLVFVDQEKRNKGYGSVLLNNLIEILKSREVQKIFLEVSSKNKPALKLYEKSGFKLNRVRENYYKNSNAYELVMEL